METKNQITIWQSVKKSKFDKPEFQTIEHWLDLIKNTPKDYLDLINDCRTLGKGSASYKILKSQLPVSQLNGSFPNRTADSCTSLTGFAYLDIDDCDIELNPIALSNSPHVYSFWKSVSGCGLGILVQYEVGNQDFNDLLEEIATHLEIKLDTNAKGLPRLNFLSSDPDIYINKDCVPFKSNLPTKGEKCNLNITTKTKNIFTLGLHFSDTTKGLKFEVTLPEYKSDVVFEEHPYFKAYWPFQNKGIPKTVYEGGRNNTLTAFINNLRILNPLKRDHVEALAHSYNRNYCRPALSSSEVTKMVSNAYSKELNPIGVKIKKIWVDPNVPNKKAAIGDAKRFESLNKITDYLAEALCESKKITPTSISKATGLSRKTIYKYWSEFKEDIEEFNLNLKSVTLI